MSGERVSPEQGFEVEEDSGQEKVRQKIEKEHPELAAVLQRLHDPALSREEFFREIEAYNANHPAKREGMYSLFVDAPVDGRNIAAKVFENGTASLSGSDLRE